MQNSRRERRREETRRGEEIREGRRIKYQEIWFREGKVLRGVWKYEDTKTRE